MTAMRTPTDKALLGQAERRIRELETALVESRRETDHCRKRAHRAEDDKDDLRTLLDASEHRFVVLDGKFERAQEELAEANKKLEGCTWCGSGYTPCVPTCQGRKAQAQAAAIAHQDQPEESQRLISDLKAYVEDEGPQGMGLRGQKREELLRRAVLWLHGQSLKRELMDQTNALVDEDHLEEALAALAKINGEGAQP